MRQAAADKSLRGIYIKCGTRYTDREEQERERERERERVARSSMRAALGIKHERGRRGMAASRRKK